MAIVTGAGDRAFSAGNDLKHQAGGGKMGARPPGSPGLTSRFDLHKPLIAAVNGVAMGGGFEIALACDLIIASENAVFALPEPRVGLAALAGGLHRLPRQIGLKRAMGMILTARRVSAREGLELGFVNEVVAPGELMAAARRWAGLICECSPMSIRASKQAVMKGLDEPTLEAALGGQNRYDGRGGALSLGGLRRGPHGLLREAPAAVEGPLTALADNGVPRFSGRPPSLRAKLATKG